MAYRRKASPAQVEQNKLRPISNKDSVKLRQWLIDRRFVLEIQRIEREGRVQNRQTLEKEIGMFPGAVATIRRGKLSVQVVHVTLLKEIYNVDEAYILHGKRIAELAEPKRYLKGIGWQDLLLDPVTKQPREGYTHPYKETAKWKAGPWPEEDVDHYPADPMNLQHPHNLPAGNAKQDDDGESSDEEDLPIMKVA